MVGHEVGHEFGHEIIIFTYKRSIKLPQGKGCLGYPRPYNYNWALTVRTTNSVSKRYVHVRNQTPSINFVPSVTEGNMPSFVIFNSKIKKKTY